MEPLGIIGQGFVGNAVREGMKTHFDVKAFDKDPNKFKNAKKITEIDWKTFRRDIVGYEWIPGKNAPFDPTASGTAEKLGLKVSILFIND